MANQITDNRTLIHAADAVAPYDDLSGAAAGTLDTEIKVQGSGSIGEYLTNTLGGCLYDAGSTQSAWANSVFYIWINCGIVGLLDTKANGGFRIRFCGNTVTDFFEFYVGGSDSWPNATSGGWVQFVVDIEATASNTGGTPPATNACRYIGWAGVTGGTMPRMADNTWIDEIRRLPANTPAVIVEGRNGGTTDWTWADIVTQLGAGVGVVKDGPGGSYILNGPVRFGANDTSTHGFSCKNEIILWEDQEFISDGFYFLDALGNSGGTTNVVFGEKSGTGDDATGAQGCMVSAASTGSRWDMDFNDPNLDLVGLYGCQFSHGGAFLLDDPAVSVISTTIIDTTSALVSNAEFLRNRVVNANTADGAAFLTTDDLGDVVFCDFEFSDGHAIELTTPRVATQTSKGNTFTGYGATSSNDAAVYNNTGGAVTINVTNDGSTPTYRNGTSASTDVQNTKTLTVDQLVAGTEVRIFRTSDSVELAGVESSSTSFAYNYNYVSDVNVYIILQKTDYQWRRINATLKSTNQTIQAAQRIDRDYLNP